MGNCCSSPAASGHETAKRHPDEQTVEQQPQVQGQQSASMPPLSLAAAGNSNGGMSPVQLSARSMDWYSTVDGGMSDAEDDWQDAMSELSSMDLAVALEDWEDEHQQHDAGIDEAIQVLKAHGHLLPADLQLAAQGDSQAERLAAAVDGTARLHVAAVLSTRVKLERSRSQQLHAALDQPPVRQQLAEAASLCKQGRVLGAAEALQAAAAAAGCSVEELAALSSGVVSAVLPAGATPLDISRVKQEAQLVEQALEALEDHSGWMVSRNDVLQVYYRHLRGETVHSLKFRAVFDHPLEHLLALAHEFDLIPTWNKFSLAAMIVAEPSLFEAYVYGAQWMLKPFKDMQALLHARGFDLAKEHRCLLVCLDDAPLEQLPQGHTPLPPEFAKRKHINFLPGSCLKIRPLPPSPDGTPRTEGSLMIHMDPHIPYIPAFLLNFVLGVLAPYVFNQMKAVLDGSFADPLGEYSRRIAAQPHIYDLARRRMDEYADVLQAEAAVAAPAGEAAAAEKKQRRGRSKRMAPAPAPA